MKRLCLRGLFDNYFFLEPARHRGKHGFCKRFPAWPQCLGHAVPLPYVWRSPSATLPVPENRRNELSSWHFLPSFGCGHPGFSLPEWPLLRWAGSGLDRRFDDADTRDLMGSPGLEGSYRVKEAVSDFKSAIRQCADMARTRQAVPSKRDSTGRTPAPRPRLLAVRGQSRGPR